MSDSIQRDEPLRDEIAAEIFVKGTQTNDVKADVEATIDRVEQLIQRKQTEAYDAGFSNRKFISDSQARRIGTLEDAYENLQKQLEGLQS